jgi:hypothetical protein
LGLLSLGLGPPFVKLAAGLDGGHGAGPPRPAQQLLQVLPLYAPLRPNPSPFHVFKNEMKYVLQILTCRVTGRGNVILCRVHICSLSDNIS